MLFLALVLKTKALSLCYIPMRIYKMPGQHLSHGFDKCPKIASNLGVSGIKCGSILHLNL